MMPTANTEIDKPPIDYSNKTPMEIQRELRRGWDLEAINIRLGR